MFQYTMWNIKWMQPGLIHKSSILSNNKILLMKNKCKLCNIGKTFRRTIIYIFLSSFMKFKKYKQLQSQLFNVQRRPSRWSDTLAKPIWATKRSYNWYWVIILQNISTGNWYWSLKMQISKTHGTKILILTDKCNIQQVNIWYQ